MQLCLALNKSVRYTIRMNIINTLSYKIAVNATGDKNASKIAILMPGRLDTKDYANFTSHLDVLAKQGYFAVAIDAPGTWESPGDINEYNTSTYLKTVNQLIDHYGNKPTLLLGHSRGGATAMLASANPAVSGLVVVNSAYGKPSKADPNNVINGYLKESRDLPPGNKRTKEQKIFKLPLKYFEDGAKHDPILALQLFKKPKLIVHGTKDEFVGITRVKEIYATLASPKMFIQINSAHDYRLYPSAISKVNSALEDFLVRYNMIFSS